MSITSIENLSNEFFYEIFDYLDGCDIYNAFSNLNYRFEEFLKNSSVLFKIKFDDSILNEICINAWKHMIHLNTPQILSIYLSMSFDINCLLAPVFINSSFTNLQSLVLVESQLNLFMFLFDQLIYLPKLCSLTIKELNRTEDLTNIYQTILCLPMLKYYKISIYYCNPSISSLNLTNERLSSIEYLHMNHSCTFNELSTIICRTPKLRHLSFKQARKPDGTIGIIFPFILINLTYLRLHVSHVKFNEFEIFIRQVQPQLKVLHFSTSSDDIAYLDADRWERLILKDLPQLEKFSLRYNEYINDDHVSNVRFQGSNPFFSSFWLKRKWIFETELAGEKNHLFNLSLQVYEKEKNINLLFFFLQKKMV